MPAHRIPSDIEQSSIIVVAGEVYDLAPLVVVGGVLLHTQCCGTVVPTATTAGYCIGCTFQHLDGTDGSALYVNEGTGASCTFNLINVD